MDLPARLLVVLAFGLLSAYGVLDSIQDRHDRAAIERLQREQVCGGASSVTAYVGRDGKIHQSTPVSTTVRCGP